MTAKPDTYAPSLSDAIKADKERTAQREFVDCMPCKVIGAGAFGGLGVYTWYSGLSQLRQNEAEILKKGGRSSLVMRRFGIKGTAVFLVGLGAYRLFSD